MIDIKVLDEVSGQEMDIISFQELMQELTGTTSEEMYKELYKDEVVSDE